VTAELIDTAVLLTGRGGSGTRLLSELARELGVFIGNYLNKSGDSNEWVALIYRMTVENGGGCDLPSGSRYRQDLRNLAQQIIGVDPTREPSLWGLKLPETMLVLPLLIDAFPRAKIVHLTRHPVSSSLRRTHMTSRLSNVVGAIALPAAYRCSGRDIAMIATDEAYLHNAYSWNFQVGRVASYGRAELGSERYLEIAYEDLCVDPSRVVSVVRSFIGRADSRASGFPRVDLSRAPAWDPADPRVETIWSVCGETAATLGYTRAAAAPTRSTAERLRPAGLDMRRDRDSA